MTTTSPSPSAPAPRAPAATTPEATALLDLLGLDVDRDAGTGTMTVSGGVLNGAGSLWGGCGLAAAIAVGEQVLGRACVWATTQCVAPVVTGARLELVVEVGHRGGSLTQAVVRATVDGRPALLTTGAFGLPGSSRRPRPDGAPRTTTTQFVQAPVGVPAPEDCPLDGLPWPVGSSTAGMCAQIELRWPATPVSPFDGRPGTGHGAFWARLARPGGTSLGQLAILADMAPALIPEAMGEPALGISLDNTIRAADTAATDWVLLDVQVEKIFQDVAQLTTRMFGERGELLALATQSLVTRRRGGPVPRARLQADDAPPPA